MTAPASILKGLAQRIADGGAFAFREADAYLATENPITFGSMHAKAATALCLTEYTPTDTTTRATHALIQVRLRAPTYLTGVDLGEGIRDLLHQAIYLNFGGVPISKIVRQSVAHLGSNAAGQHEWTHNYRVLYTRTT